MIGDIKSKYDLSAFVLLKETRGRLILECKVCKRITDKGKNVLRKKLGKVLVCGLCRQDDIDQHKTNCLRCNKKNSIRDAKYCSLVCYAENKREAVLKRWEENPRSIIKLDISKTIRKLLLEKANYKCSNCGFSGNNPISGKSILQVDHINGDPSDHSESNLRVLCPNCHAMTETYGHLNLGKGRRSRLRKQVS